ncbi:hypothetical protein KM043_013035 [Ampulex compressa]|nr:hypothetical protein KM043_013035 [Ampulex compressa]
MIIDSFHSAPFTAAEDSRAMRQAQPIVVFIPLLDLVHITTKHCLTSLPVGKISKLSPVGKNVRRRFEYECPTVRECQPDSSAREDRLPRALLSACFVRHRREPRSPERPDPPIAPSDIVGPVPTSVPELA